LYLTAAQDYIDRLPGGNIVKKCRWTLHIAIYAILLSAPGVRSTLAQAKPSPAVEKEPTGMTGFSPANEAELDSVREQLFKLLRMSPKLTSAISLDPTLLSYQEYVNKNNPELAGFLQSHPEIPRNPEFYLFANLPGGKNGNVPFLFQRAVWPEIGRGNSSDIGEDIIIFFVFLIVLSAILWLLRMLLQNRRWNRIFKVQTEIHTKLLDKLGGSQELFAYLGTEAGKKFMELAPIATALESTQRPGLLSPITRILAPLQLGIVSTLIGLSLLFIKGYFKDSEALLFVGTMALALGIGFIISAGVSWLLAQRLGLIAQIKLGRSDSKPQ
jgi:hypothetical protein